MTDGLPMTIHEQDVEMRRDWPSFRRLLFDPIEERVAWRGTLHPRINRYTVEIDYSMDWVIRGPKVRVIAPVLTRLPENPEGDLPHVYDRKRDPSLCLFDPRRREWTGWMPISKKIVPWTIDWLTCYEGWLLTGVWHGGGAHVGAPIGMYFNLESAR